MPITYVVDWSYNNIFSLYGMRQPRMLKSATIKYATLNRTFNCNNDTEQLGYKPIVSLMVVTSTYFDSIFYTFILIFFGYADTFL
jgi:plant 3beta-hydroxysteroid-4alpha-carboxylate 3-dehydrogenase